MPVLAYGAGEVSRIKRQCHVILLLLYFVCYGIEIKNFLILFFLPTLTLLFSADPVCTPDAELARTDYATPQQDKRCNIHVFRPLTTIFPRQFLPYRVSNITINGKQNYVAAREGGRG